MTPQTTPPSTLKSTSTERREREEWSTHQNILQDQLLDKLEEYRYYDIILLLPYMVMLVCVGD